MREEHEKNKNAGLIVGIFAYVKIKTFSALFQLHIRAFLYPCYS